MDKSKLTEMEQSLLPFIEALSKVKMNFDRAIDETIANLDRKGYISVTRALVYGTYRITGISLRKKKKPKERDFTELARKMIDCFPKGQKEMEGRSYPWRLSPSMTVLRLNKLVEKTGEEFSDEDAVRATKAYVASFGPERIRFMKLLKYFIFKEKEDGLESDLLTWIETVKDMTDEELAAQQPQEVLTNENFL